MIPSAWIDQAEDRIAPHVRKTPLSYDASLDIYLKWENRQITGSFKLRGALNKILSLQSWEQERGLVTASAGNHGQGVALAGDIISAPVIIFASEHAVPAKIHAMQALGAQVHLVKGGYGEAEQAGLAFARENQSTWVSPYNDGLVIAGQGTLARETLRQLPVPVQAWVVPIGGGGLISGIGAVLDHLSPGKQLIGVQSVASPFFHSIFHQNSQDNVMELPSLADGLAGPVEEGAVTIPLVKRYVADIVLVNEAEIKQAIRYSWQHYQEQIEGSAAVSLAAVLTGKITSRPAVVILSGGNIQPEIHQKILLER